MVIKSMKTRKFDQIKYSCSHKQECFKQSAFFPVSYSAFFPVPSNTHFLKQRTFWNNFFFITKNTPTRKLFSSLSENHFVNVIFIENRLEMLYIQTFNFHLRISFRLRCYSAQILEFRLMNEFRKDLQYKQIE